MLKEALEQIELLTRRAITPYRLEADSDYRASRYVIDSEVETVSRDPLPRTHRADTLDAFATAVNTYGGGTIPPVVWFDETAVIAVLDDDDYRANQVKMPLAFSDVKRSLDKLQTEKWLDLKTFSRMLRTEFAGTIPPELLLAKIRMIDWSNKTVTQAEVTRNRESLGKSVEAAHRSTEEIPESIRFSFRVWQAPAPAILAQITCLVEIDATSNVLMLKPAPDEMTRAVNAALDELGLLLKAKITKNTPCYRGRP